MAPYPPQPYPPQPYPPQAYPPQVPPPGGYPQPPMYGPPPVMMAAPPPGVSTFEGLKWLKTASLLAMAYNGVGALGAILLAATLASFSATTDPFAMMGALGAALAVALIAGIIGFIALILGIMGLYNVDKGKNEFGTEHAASVSKGNRFLLFAILTAVGGIAATFVLGFAIGFGGGLGTFDPNAFVTYMIATAAVAGAITLIETFFLALSLQSYIERLVTAKGRAMRNNFVVLSVVGAAAALALGVVGAILYASTLANPLTMGTSASLAPIASFISIITLNMYRMQVADAEQGCRTMIQTGLLNPDGAAPVAPPIAPAPALGPMQPR